MPASFVYSKSVHKVFIALFVEYALCFVLCHNLRLHMPKTCGIGKTVLSVSCARFKSHFWKSRPFPTLRQRDICPCLSRSTQISRLCPLIFFSSAGGVNACAGVLFCKKNTQTSWLYCMFLTLQGVSKKCNPRLEKKLRKALPLSFLIMANLLNMSR